MSRCSATGVLREEHGLILRVAGAMSETMLRPASAGVLDAMEDCVAFLRLFADACHHGKEEDLLFDALVEEGFSREDGPIAVMLYEHEVGREYVRALDAAVAAVRSGDDEAWHALRAAGFGYVELIRQHILKEDHILFGMADAAVPEPACRRLCDAYDAACARSFEGRSVAELTALAERIIAGAAPATT